MPASLIPQGSPRGGFAASSEDAAHIQPRRQGAGTSAGWCRAGAGSRVLPGDAPFPAPSPSRCRGRCQALLMAETQAAGVGAARKGGKHYFIYLFLDSFSSPVSEPTSNCSPWGLNPARSKWVQSLQGGSANTPRLEPGPSLLLCHLFRVFLCLILSDKCRPDFPASTISSG